MSTATLTDTTVYVLTAELRTVDGDYDGISTVHATREGALERFERFVAETGLSSNVVRRETVTYETFVGGDPDPDLLDGTELHWGINTTTVRP